MIICHCCIDLQDSSVIDGYQFSIPETQTMVTTGNWMIEKVYRDRVIKQKWVSLDDPELVPKWKTVNEHSFGSVSLLHGNDEILGIFSLFSLHLISDKFQGRLYCHLPTDTHLEGKFHLNSDFELSGTNRSQIAYNRKEFSSENAQVLPDFPSAFNSDLIGGEKSRVCAKLFDLRSRAVPATGLGDHSLRSNLSIFSLWSRLPD